VTRARRRHGGTTCALALLPFLAACTLFTPTQYQVEPVPYSYGCDRRVCPDSDQVEVTYLGVSGFLIAYRGHVLLTAPLFSNPPITDVAPAKAYPFWRAPTIRPDSQLIERLLPRAADSASMILVGHSHYDHLLDVPYIATHRATSATIYGTPTMRHILMGDPRLRAGGGARLRDIPDANLGSATRAGTWYYDRDSAFRIMALAADHAPTFRMLGLTITFASGSVDHDLDTLPRTAEAWRLGETYTYLIDVLRRGSNEPVFRIYYQDAPNRAPKGFPPPLNAIGRPVDLAILCLPTSRNVRPAAPDSLLSVLAPRYVVASHWESFFRPQIYPLMLNPESHMTAFIRSLHTKLPPTSRWVIPSPRTVLRFDAGASRR
jgi:L-ascorbate metabolism protein UlaG (beta-lactamase superfamily)